MPTVIKSKDGNKYVVPTPAEQAELSKKASSNSGRNLRYDPQGSRAAGAHRFMENGGRLYSMGGKLYKDGGETDPTKEESRSTGKAVNTVYGDVDPKEALKKAGVVTQTGAGGRTAVRAVNIATPPKAETKEDTTPPRGGGKPPKGGKPPRGYGKEDKVRIKTPFGQKKYRRKLFGKNKGAMVARKRLIGGGGGVNARQTARGRS